MIYGYIYKIKTTKSDKVYIGQTTRTVAERFAEHLKNSTEKSKYGIHLYHAMNLYGKETFSVEQIDFAENREELNDKERYWIKFYNSIINGYNMMEGGNDENPMSSQIVKEKHDRKMRSKKVRSKISKAMKDVRSIYGFSDEHKRKIQESRQKRKVERNRQGLNFYEHPEKRATRSRRVYCILSSGERYEFDSILHAGQW